MPSDTEHDVAILSATEASQKHLQLSLTKQLETNASHADLASR